MDIDAPWGINEEIIKEFTEEFKKINDKYIGQPMDSNIVYRLASDLEYLLQDDRYMGIEVKNNEFFTDKLWSLEKLLDTYSKKYPDRYTDKKEYTNMEINNMLFELKIGGVIGGYRSPAVCADIPSHNNKVFSDEYINVLIPIIHIKG